jgi:hypothetical protein
MFPARHAAERLGQSFEKREAGRETDHGDGEGQTRQHVAHLLRRGTRHVGDLGKVRTVEDTEDGHQLACLRRLHRAASR